MLTVEQAAEKAGVSKSLIYAWCQIGVLPCYRLGRPGRRGTVRIDPDELAGFLEAMRQPAPDGKSPERN